MSQLLGLCPVKETWRLPNPSASPFKRMTRDVRGRDSKIFPASTIFFCHASDAQGLSRQEKGVRAAFAVTDAPFEGECG
jgi:hypothetical protein